MFSLNILLRVCFLRLVVHHDLAFPVEGVCHHAGQLSSSLHHQIPEAQVFTTELLQTILVSRTWPICAVVLCFFELSSSALLYSLIPGDGQVTCGSYGTTGTIKNGEKLNDYSSDLFH